MITSHQKFKTVIYFTLQPNKVVGHVLPPLLMAYCGGSLRCMKLLIEVQLFLDFYLMCPYQLSYAISVEYVVMITSVNSLYSYLNSVLSIL
jgi:hypothetical protein